MDFALIAADLDLVPLFAVLVDAEDADVADVMLAAGVDAARDVQVDLTNVVQIVEIVEAPLYRLGHGNGFRVRERAQIAARAGDEIGQESDVGSCQPQQACHLPYLVQISAA